MIRIIISLLILISIAGSKTIAQNKKEISVSEAVERLRKAMVDGDKSALEKWTSDELSYGHSSGRVENKADLIESLTSSKSDFVSIDLTEQTIKVHGKTAIVRHTLFANTNDAGKPGTVKLAILLVWQKHNSHWKLLARQAVRLQ